VNCQWCCTNKLADKRLNINILQVLTAACVIQSKCAVQTNWHPDSIADPRHLTNLTLTTRVNVKRTLTVVKDYRRLTDATNTIFSFILVNIFLFLAAFCYSSIFGHTLCILYCTSTSLAILYLCTVFLQLETQFSAYKRRKQYCSVGRYRGTLRFFVSGVPYK